MKNDEIVSFDRTEIAEKSKISKKAPEVVDIHKTSSKLKMGPFGAFVKKIFLNPCNFWERFSQIPQILRVGPSFAGTKKDFSIL